MKRKRTPATVVGLSHSVKDYVEQASKRRPAGSMSAHQAERPVVYRVGDLIRSTKPTKDRATGMVSRSYDEEKDKPPPIVTRTGLSRELRHDEVGILWSPSQEKQIVPSATVELVDRAFHLGEYCKLYEEDIQSGLVVKVTKMLKLQHIFTDDVIDHPVPEADVCQVSRIRRGDHVIYNDWVGEVELILEHAVLEIAGDPRLARVTRIGKHMPLGKKTLNIAGGNIDLGNVDLARVLEVRPRSLAINWLAINQKLSSEEQAKRPRPPDEFKDIDNLKSARTFHDEEFEIGDQVIFKSEELREKHNGKQSVHGNANIVVKAMHVVETERVVTVLWQDGKQTEEKAKTLYKDNDFQEELDMWPGNWVWWKPEDQPSGPRILQSVDPVERTAVVYSSTDSMTETELVPILEIAPTPQDPELCRVLRRDSVMICAESTGLKGFVTAIGDETVPTTGDSSMIKELESDSRLPSPVKVDSEPVKKFSDSTDIDWYGTVIDLLTDGRCVVSLANGQTVVESLDHVHLLRGLYLDPVRADNHDHHHHSFHHDFDHDLHHVHDHDNDLYDDEDAMIGRGNPMLELFAHLAEERSQGPLNLPGNGVMAYNFLASLFGAADQLEDEYYDDEYYDDEYYDDEYYDDEMAYGDENDGQYSEDDIPWRDDMDRIVSGDQGEWEEMSDVDEVDEVDLQAAEQDHSKKLEARSQDAEQAQAKRPARITGDTTSNLNDATDAESAQVDVPASWTQFEVLESAPKSHALYKSELASSKLDAVFMKRLKKEFKILKSSLPDTILVRAYEDRSDLLRVLIFGSEGTPYEHAPFLLDFLLPGDFPNSPPVAHFHSWTNNRGRISPNLYEDGTVCLSVLGTWSGQSAENWNPTKSSLLQVFVSIQALVLVREPYYTEPMFEKLQGKPGSLRDARLCSENAYISARGFVRHALTHPVEGFECEVKEWYLQRGNLSKVINRAKTLINSLSSSASGTADSGHLQPLSDEPLTTLTKGGAIMLTRSIKALEAVLNTQT